MKTTLDLDAHLDHLITVIGLTIRPEWRADILASLTLVASAAELILDFPLDDTVEPATVFGA